MADQNHWLHLQAVLETDLFELLGLNTLPATQQDELYLMVMESIRDRVIIRIIDILGPKKEKEWFKLLDKNDDPAVVAFLEKHNVNVRQLTIEETVRYKLELAERLNLAPTQASA